MILSFCEDVFSRRHIYFTDIELHSEPFNLMLYVDI
jgi:hypothetical protein